MEEENEKPVYDSRAREEKAFRERMQMTTFKPKAVEYLIRAEGAAGHEMGQYFASIAQVYATLELARVNAANRPKK